MRHRRKGRILGRAPAHQRALLASLTANLFLTERETTELDDNAPKVKGRIITTLPKAKEVRPLVEKCITIAKKGLAAGAGAEQYATSAPKHSDAWNTWRKSGDWNKWSVASAPLVLARRRVFQMIRNKEAVSVLFEKIAPRFADRNGGYTRILKLAKPRLGDAGKRAMLEFVGVHDRVQTEAVKPSFAEESAS